MAQFKMKYGGGIDGKKSGRYHSFNKGQIIEAPDGEFDEADAEKLSESVEKKKAEVSGKEVETAAVKPKSLKRDKKKVSNKS